MGLNAQSKLLQEAAQRYALEITPETLVALAERGISEAVATKYQIGTIVDPINGHEMYEGWISIPYITVNGSCVGFKFRRLDDGKPKYGSPTGQKAHLYNVKDITISSKYIVITEGELDANDVKEDGSNPGAEFAKRVANEVMNSTIVTLPPSMDINDYYLANGVEATRNLLIGESNE